MRRCAQALADKAVGVVLLDVILGWGTHPDPAGQLVRALGGSSGGRPGDHRLRDRHGGRSASPLRAGAQAHGGRQSSWRPPMPPRPHSHCNASRDVDLDVGAACPALCRAPRRRMRRSGIPAQLLSRGARRFPLHRRREHRPRSAQRAVGERAWTRLSESLPPVGSKCKHRSGHAAHRLNRARCDAAPSLGAPPPGRRHGNPRALRGRCEDWSVSLQSRLRSTALRASCWALRAIGPRLWSGTARPRVQRLRAWLIRRRSASGRFAGARPRPDAVGRRRSVWDARGVACGRAGRHGARSSMRRLPRRHRRRHRRSPLRSCVPRPRGWAARPCMPPSLRFSRDRPTPSATAPRLWAASATPPAGTRWPAPCSSCRHSAQCKGSLPESHGRGFASKLDETVSSACRVAPAQRIWGLG